ncbi:MAG TPA: rhomboid family intramembrane serine protease [Acidobacteriota bacterium]|nr:rhomboid family intramembrane serine protease [Acidobacteriota bacterium]
MNQSRSIRAEKALESLYHSDGERFPVVTYGFLGLCLLITIPTLFFPGLYEIFGGVEPRRHCWQVFTAAFEHGWPGFHGSIHLALNTFLILECGRPCERLLGSRRFLVLGLLSLAANALVLALTEGANGSSMVIWSWGPPLFAALLWSRRQDPSAAGSAASQRIVGILVVMYAVITLVMGLLPYLFGWRGNPLVALFRANIFHLTATAVGALFTLASAGHIRQRLSRLAVVE